MYMHYACGFEGGFDVVAALNLRCSFMRVRPFVHHVYTPTICASCCCGSAFLNLISVSYCANLRAATRLRYQMPKPMRAMSTIPPHTPQISAIRNNDGPSSALVPSAGVHPSEPSHALLKQS